MSNRHSSKSHRSSSSRHISHHASGSRQRDSGASYDLDAQAAYAAQSQLPVSPSSFSGYSYTGQNEANPSSYSRNTTRLSGSTLAGGYDASYSNQSRWSRNTSSTSGYSQSGSSARSSEVPRSSYSDHPAASSSRQHRESGQPGPSVRNSRPGEPRRSIASVSTGILGEAQAVPIRAVSRDQADEQIDYERFKDSMAPEDRELANNSGGSTQENRVRARRAKEERERRAREQRAREKAKDVRRDDRESGGRRHGGGSTGGNYV